MELSLTTIPTLFKQAEEEKNNYPLIKEAFERLESYTKLGLHKGIEQAKKGILSAIINSNGLRLIEIFQNDTNWGKRWAEVFNIFNINTDGSISQIDNNNWAYQSLYDFSGNKNNAAIPLEALKKIQVTTKDKLGVFYRQTIDPILVYPLTFTENYYITYKGFFEKKTKIVNNNLPGNNSMFIALRQWD